MIKTRGISRYFHYLSVSIRTIAGRFVQQGTVAAGLIVCVVSTTSLTAATFDLTPVDQGSITRSLTGFSLSLSESIFHDATSTSVNLRNANQPLGPPLFQQNAFLSAGYLIFSLPTTGGGIVTSALLDLEWTGASFLYNVNQVHSDPTLLQSSFSVSGGPLSPLFGPEKPLLNDLTGGPSYASDTTPGTDSLVLNPTAIADINARLGGQFVVGLFGGDQTFNSAGLVSATLHLQAPTAVPEPSLLATLSVFAMVVGGRRKRESRSAAVAKCWPTD